MSTAITAAAPTYRRQTPTIWQAIGQTLWLALEQAGRRRASRELHQLAARWESIDPALAAQLREAARHDTTHQV